MVKAKTLYYFRGVNSRAICRGEPCIRKETLKGIVYDWKFKHRGMFSHFQPIKNIKDVCVSKPVPLIVGNKILESWNVVEVNFDILSGEPYLPDIEPSIIAKYNHIQSELEMWKKRCYALEEKLTTLDNKDRFDEKMSKELKKIQESRNAVLGYSSYSGFESPYFNRFPMMGQQQNE